MKKKIISLLTVVCMLLSFVVACTPNTGNDSDSSYEENEATDTETGTSDKESSDSESRVAYLEKRGINPKYTESLGTMTQSSLIR